MRTALDFVEAPALLFERFASEPAVLASWARHVASRAPLPASLAESARRASRRFSGLETQTQCLHALVDLALHSRPPVASGGSAGGSPTSLGFSWTPQQTSDLVRELTAAHTVLPLPAAGGGPYWHAGFRHLASYGTGYYTYLWARSVSGRVWQSSFAAQPLMHMHLSGERWCAQVLRHGGAREPLALLQEFLRHGSQRPARRAGQICIVEQALLELVSLDAEE